MRSSPYKNVLDRLASQLGEADGLSTDDAALITPKLNTFVRMAWEFYWWPDLMAIEKRTFRPGYNAATAYAGPTAGSPVEVFFPQPGYGSYSSDTGSYYQALQPSTGQVPATLTNGAWVENSAYWALSCDSYSADLWQTGKVFAVGDQTQNPNDGNYYQCIVPHTAGATFDATKFGLLTAFVRSLDYDQVDGTGNALTSLGEVRFIWDRDPTVVRYAQRQKFRLRPDFIQVLGCQNVVWVEFRLRPAVYTNTVFDPTAAYASGIQIYDPATGENWLSNTTTTAGQSPTSTPAKWTKVPFPYAFVEYTALSVYAALTNREEAAASQGGQPENFGIQQTAGFPLLQLELDKIERQQGQTRQLNVVTGKDSMGGWWYRS